MIKKMLVTAVAAVAMLALTASTAFADDYYYGRVYVRDNPGGWEQLYLGDSSDGTYMHVEGDEDACGARGASYATMRNVVYNDDDGYMDWWVDVDCGNLVRICIENDWNQWACSSYWFLDWE